MRKIIISIIVVLGVVFGSGLAISAISQSRKNETYKELELFADSLAYVLSEYVDETKPKDLIYGAIAGMINNLDPHSQFLPPDEYEDLKVDTEGKFGGIGIELTMKDNMATIITPIEDTPAWDAGIEPNDRIIKIDDIVVRKLVLNEIVKKLRGKPGTDVVLVIWREKLDNLLTFKIKRAMIQVKDIKEAKILEGAIGYLKVVEFRENTVQELDRVLTALKAQGMDSLIIDLRNNPGGLLDRASEMAERFVPKGSLVVSVKSRDPRLTMDFISKFPKPTLDLPIVVLVNGGSASGSEIFAGALQDYRRAIILGTKTFGKGSVQTVLPLRDGSALKLTTSRYYTPKGQIIHERGIHPDVVIEQPEIVKIPGDLKEKKSEEIFNKVEESDSLVQREKALEKLYASDNQLARAVDLLKGIKVYKKMFPII